MSADQTSTPPPKPQQRLLEVTHFAGREADIAWVVAALQPGQVVTLWGPGGVGKSAIAQVVLEQLAATGALAQHFPDGVITHSFYGQPDMALFMAHIVRTLAGEQAQDVTPAAARRLMAGKQFLLVLDGAEEAEDWRAVLAMGQPGGILITSRDRENAVSAKWRREIRPLPTADAVRVLQGWEIGGLTEELAGQMCAWVGGLPLAVQLMGRYLDVTGEDVAAYWAWLQAAPIKALHLDTDAHKENSVGLLLARSLTQVGETGRQILGVLGALAATPVALDLIVESLNLGADAGRRLGTELVRYGLVRRQGEMVETGHALIHTYAHRYLQPEAATLTTLQENLVRRIRPIADMPVALLAWAAHLQAVTERALADEERAKTEETAYLCNQLGYIFDTMGDYEGARPYYEEALAISQAVLGERHPDTASSLNNLAILCYYEGKLAEAAQFMGQALAVWEAVLGKQHPDTVSARGSLAVIEEKLKGQSA